MTWGPMTGTLSHYRIVRKIGEGGMGVIYEAWDERLGRAVALKTVRMDQQSAEACQRLWREARSLARVSHPNICQIFDAEQSGDALFLVLELLQGETLAQRLKGGPIPVAEVPGIACQILVALEALHRLSIVHRDLKPSNVFLTPHGIKLLDFGLAGWKTPRGPSEETATLLTAAGTILGTPYYMAPEQARGSDCGPAADIFAAGCVLYEMLAGTPPFRGASAIDVLYSVLHHEPPPLGGSAAIEALDRVIRRALAKEAAARWPSAAAMRAALDSAEVPASTTGEVRPRTIQRLIALPFRMPRKDEDIEFLAYSLPDAITNSLARLDSLIVRSSMVAARFAEEADPQRIAAEAQVDVILTGSLLRIGGQVRVSCQLVEAPGGGVLWSHATNASMHDLFSLQDELANRIISSLLPPLSDRQRLVLDRDVPRNARAYECFLRANQLAWQRGSDNMRLARDLYRECLADDPQYSPAWAGLGRALRFIYKFGDEPEETFERAADAFRRAFALNPDLALAHNLYTPTECDLGNAGTAMARLLERARSRRYDADLFAGLVHACRYCGELEASVAAHEHVRHVDPHVATSVAHTWFLLGDYQKALEYYPGGAAYYMDCAALASSGGGSEALARLRHRESSIGAAGTVGALMASLKAYLEGDMAGCLRAVDAGEALVRRDPESIYYMARHLARAGAGPRALAMLSTAIGGGFLCAAALERDPWLAPLRGEPGFADLSREVQHRRSEMRALFESAGGPQVLALPS